MRASTLDLGPNCERWLLRATPNTTFVSNAMAADVTQPPVGKHRREPGLGTDPMYTSENP